LKVLVVKSTSNAGDICAIVGVEGFEIGDTIADFENPEAYKQFY
jgi:GTP-binding protein